MMFTSFEERITANLRQEIAPLQTAINEVKATAGAANEAAQQALAETRAKYDRQNAMQEQITVLQGEVTKLREASPHRQGDDKDVPMTPIGAPAAHFAPYRPQPERPPAPGPPSSSASTTAASSPTRGRPMIVLGGWDRDTPKGILEAAATDFLNKYAETFRSHPGPHQVRAPLTRASTVNLDFHNHDEMWGFFKLLKQKEKDDSGLCIQERKIWATVDKPPAARIRDKQVRRAGAYLKQKLNLGDAPDAMEIDWKVGLIWINSVRIARIHKDTNLMKFNTEHLATIGHPAGPFLKEWDTFCKKDEREEW